jgi:hypothetical protein
MSDTSSIIYPLFDSTDEHFADALGIKHAFDAAQNLTFEQIFANRDFKQYQTPKQEISIFCNQGDPFVVWADRTERGGICVYVSYGVDLSSVLDQPWGMYTPKEKYVNDAERFDAWQRYNDDACLSVISASGWSSYDAVPTVPYSYVCTAMMPGVDGGTVVVDALDAAATDERVNAFSHSVYSGRFEEILRTTVRV